jgi:hypothetical protein
VRSRTRQVHLGGHIGAESLCRVFRLVKGVCRVKPDRADFLDHPAVEVFLGAKIIIHIGFGYTCAFRDQAYARSLETLLSKHRFCCRQNFGDIFTANPGFMTGVFCYFVEHLSPFVRHLNHVYG